VKIMESDSDRRARMARVHGDPGWHGERERHHEVAMSGKQGMTDKEEADFRSKMARVHGKV
jgi:hypothetical protein